LRNDRIVDSLNLFRPASADINATKEGDSRKDNSNHTGREILRRLSSAFSSASVGLVIRVSVPKYLPPFGNSWKPRQDLSLTKAVQETGIVIGSVAIKVM